MRRIPGRLVLVVAAISRHSLAADVYFNDFNGPVGSSYPEWTSSGYTYTANAAGTITTGSGTQTPTNVDSANHKQRFLGEFGGPAIVTAPPYDPQHFVRVDQTVILTLKNLNPHDSVVLSFDLYIMKSWDGNNPNYGPDRWSLSVGGGNTLLDTTFSNNFKTDAYDLSLQNYPAPDSQPQTGAASANTLGFNFYGDSIYHLTFAFAHSNNTLILNFSSSMFEGKGTDDESWGLDNVRVSTTSGSLAILSAASPNAGLAQESLAAVYGTNLPSSAATASQPYPTNLGGVTLQIVDSAGAARLAPLISTSPMQIDFETPAGSRTGPALVLILSGTTIVQSGATVISAVAPALFSANGDGKGVAMATAVRVEEGGAEIPLDVFQCGDAAGACSSVPLDLGAGGTVHVSLYGTGIRGRQSLDSLEVTIGGQMVPVLYAGPQSALAGLDQVDVALPPSMRGMGESDVALVADGVPANTVRLNIQ
jgi:uncharacterized protein (TIGR03437 family)